MASAKSHQILDFKDLIVWRRSVELVEEVYALTRSFPREEQYGLTSQIRRAAISVSSNIAEGHARQHKEFSQFLSIARGSVAEVESQLLVSVALGYLKFEQVNKARALATEIKKMAAVLGDRVSKRASAKNSSP